MSSLPLPPVSERQLPEFRTSLDKWVIDTIQGRKSSGLAKELSAAHEAATSAPLDDRSIYVDLRSNLRGLSASVQNLGGYLIGTEISEIAYALRPFSALIAAGVQTDQRQGNLSLRRDEPAQPLEIKIVNASEIGRVDKIMTVKRDDTGNLTGAVVQAFP
jgi:hypothetical protein